jgi:hypothetical protein
MILKEVKEKNITLLIEVDYLSKYYLSGSNNIVVIDDDYILNQLHLLKQAKKKGVFIQEFKAITSKDRKQIIDSDKNWIEKNATKIKQNALITMLSNKGII